MSTGHLKVGGSLFTMQQTVGSLRYWNFCY
ncbi:hypothetical protein CIB84_001955 [Bambusicola thoracicus]|uniref:Uncharacterized protein n=1 Tax=Bambusicola thoracicus TaxID=9083 RepID=A0A2P4TD38_BAMTH|nr:hypothetical protein CIB84_001955 [Bambusicola thoracicus]